MTKSEQEAIQYGIDMNMLEYNLSLSYEKRISQHESALTLLLTLLEARKVNHPKSN